MTNKDVIVEDINTFFGPRQGKNVWKFNNNINPDQVKVIKTLYQFFWMVFSQPLW